MIPLAQRSKRDLIYLATHRCQHRHLLIEHPQCEADTPRRLGHLDIETSNLDADYGFILTWAIKIDGEDTIYTDEVTREDIDGAKPGQEDKRVVASLLAALEEFDEVTGFYSSRFDLPYIRTRALVNGLTFPPYGSLHHLDVYYAAKFKLKLSRNGLDQVCRTILGKTEKTRVGGEVWRMAARGDKKALAYVLDHNMKDVRDLEKVYHKLLPFMRRTRRSV